VFRRSVPTIYSREWCRRGSGETRPTAIGEGRKRKKGWGVDSLRPSLAVLTPAGAALTCRELL